MGYIANEPKVRTTASTVNMITFSIAVKRYNKDRNEVDFIDCIAFGKNALNIEKYFHKGSPICVRGAMQTNTYSKNDKNYKNVSLKVDEWDFPIKSKEDKYALEKSSEENDNFEIVDDDFEDFDVDAPF